MARRRSDEEDEDFEAAVEAAREEERIAKLPIGWLEIAKAHHDHESAEMILDQAKQKVKEAKVFEAEQKIILVKALRRIRNNVSEETLSSNVRRMG